MRHWLLHPVVFYPLVAVVALLLIAISLTPQAWPRPAAPVTGQIDEAGITLEGEALGTPEADPAQSLFVVRDFWGRARALRIAVLPNATGPGPNDSGVRIRLTPEAAERLHQPVYVYVTYNLLPVNAASALAVSLQGPGPANWANLPLPRESGVIRFELPASPDATALGLRAISAQNDQSYGVEITQIRIIPYHPSLRGT